MNTKTNMLKWMTCTLFSGVAFVAIGMLLDDPSVVIGGALLILIGVVCLTGEKVITRLSNTTV